MLQSAADVGVVVIQEVGDVLKIGASKAKRVAGHVAEGTGNYIKEHQKDVGDVLKSGWRNAAGVVEDMEHSAYNKIRH